MSLKDGSKKMSKSELSDLSRINLTDNKDQIINKIKKAKRLFPKNKWNDLHLQIIWYGREYSPARGWKKEKDFITKKIGRKSL